jgi:hypothetical protein
MLYTKSPFKPVPTLLEQGRPEYVFGSWLDKTGPTLGNVISDSAVTTTGTLTFAVVSGNLPAVGSLITVVGTANASGNFNVTNAQILTVVSTDGGVVTVTYAITSSSVAAGTPDGGQVIVPQPELGDIVSSFPSSSVPVACPASPSQQSGKSLSATVKLPAQQLGVASTLSAVTVVIQGANFDEDGQYNTIGTLTAAGTSVAGPNTYDWQSGQGADNHSGTGVLAEAAVNLPNFRFYRIQVSAATGSGPVIATIMF